MRHTEKQPAAAQHPWTLEWYMAMQIAIVTTLAQVEAWPKTIDTLKAPKASVSKAQVGKVCAITINNLGILCCHVGSWSTTYRLEDRGTRGVVTRGDVPTRFRAYRLKSPWYNQPEGSKKTKRGSDQSHRSLPTAH